MEPANKIELREEIGSCAGELRKIGCLYIQGFVHTDLMNSIRRFITADTVWSDHQYYGPASRANCLVHQMDIEFGHFKVEFWSTPEHYRPFVDIMAKEFGFEYEDLLEK